MLLKLKQKRKKSLKITKKPEKLLSIADNEMTKIKASIAFLAIIVKGQLDKEQYIVIKKAKWAPYMAILP